MPRLQEGVAPGSAREEMKGFLSNTSPPDGRGTAAAPRQGGRKGREGERRGRSEGSSINESPVSFLPFSCPPWSLGLVVKAMKYFRY